jgi:DNA primase
LATVLENLIAKDFTLTGSDDSKWAKTVEHDSLVIDREKQVFFWNSRHIVGDALVWLTKVKGYSFAEARQILTEYKDYRGTFVYTIKSQKTEEDIVVYPKLVDIFWEQGKKHRKYWYNRLLTDETIDRFKLGYHDEWFTIPIYIDDTFRNFQCRIDEPKKKIRPWYRGVGPLLYNSDLLDFVSGVIITEGTVDAILLNQMGFPAVSHTMGSNFDESWYKYFIKLTKITYIADYDDAGIKAAYKVAEVLDKERVEIVTFEGFGDKFDTVDFFREGGTVKEFRELLKTAKKVYEIPTYFDFSKKQRKRFYGRKEKTFGFGY